MGGRTRSNVAGCARLSRLLLLASSGASAFSVFVPLARAADYQAADETELRARIATANGDSDPVATITLTGNVAITDPTAFPPFAKPVTINTGAFTLSGADMTSAPGVSLTFSGGSLVTSGAFRGGNVLGTTTNAAGGIGLSLTSGSIDNSASIAGGIGGNNTGQGTTAGNGGTGVLLSASSIVNRGAITGGAGGNVDVNFSVSGTNTNSGAGGIGLVSNGSLDNSGTIIGGAGGSIVNTAPAGDNQFGGAGGIGASLTGGTHVNNGTISGGMGGAGINAGGTGHGVGGTGLVLSGGASFVNNNTVTGGDGRSGGGTDPAFGSAGGNGVSLINGSLENAGLIAGGNSGGNTAGGIGIEAGNATIVVSGTVNGGRSQLGAGAFATAITFSRGIVNRLELWASAVINGNVLANPIGRSDTLALGGAADGSFAVSQIGNAAKYRQFDIFEKTGSSTFTLTGTTTTTTSWRLLEGTLAISANNNLGAAAGTLTFDGGTLRNTTAFPTARTITLNSGGGTFETAANLTVSSAIAGAGALTKTGDASLILTAASTYTGATQIQSGTLALSGAGSLAASSGVVADGAFDISGVTPAGTSIQRLAGRGHVTLGDKTLAITAANDEFSGIISGTGGLALAAGAQVLTGENTYSGVTTIAAGSTLHIGNGGATGSIAGNTANDGTLVFNRANAMTHGGVVSGAGAIRQIGSGLTDLTADSSAFAGTTSVEAGTLAVNGSLCGGMNVLAGGRLQGNGTVCDTTNFADGTIAPGNSIGTLTVNGSYVGNGGTLEIESVLGGDASPSDRLVVTGDTAGATRVRVINLGGAGGQTVEGIKVVDVGGASNGAFTLQGDYVIAGQPVVVAGAHAYTLQQHGIGTPGDGDWYLRSSLAAPPGPPGQPGVPGSPGLPSAPPAEIPLYQPGVPLYESYGLVLLGLNELSTLRERVGSRHREGSDATERTGVAGAPVSVGPVWGRFEGRHLNLNPTGTALSSFDADYLKFEAGIDALTFDQGFGKFVFAVTGHYTEADADVASFFGSGTIRARGGGFGGTATWYGYDGFYVDGQARATWYASKLNSRLIGPVISDNDGFGYALGLESGKRFALGGGWSLTPQAQLTYGAVDFDTFTDRFGASVSLGHAESLLGRAGISLDHQMTWRDASGRLMRSDLYGIANLHYEFLDGASVDVSGTRFASSADRLWGGIGAGGTFSWANDGYAIYGEVSYNTSLEDTGVNYSYKGTAGFRVRW